MKIFVMNASPKGGSVLLLHLSVMLFGFSAVLGQFVDAPAVVIAGGRVVWSSAALLVFSLVQKSDLKLKSKKDCAVALAAGVVLAVHWTTFFQAIQSSSVAIGTITFSAFPLFLTFLEPQVFHKADLHLSACSNSDHRQRNRASRCCRVHDPFYRHLFLAAAPHHQKAGCHGLYHTQGIFQGAWLDDHRVYGHVHLGADPAYSDKGDVI